MKRLLIMSMFTVLAALLLQFILLPKASAVDILNQNCPSGQTNCSACDNPNATQRPTICSDNNTGGKNPLFGPGGILTTLVQILALVVGVASIFTIIISGLRIVLSSGDSGTVTTSRNAILYALVGLVVAAIAQTLVTFVLSKIKV